MENLFLNQIHELKDYKWKKVQYYCTYQDSLVDTRCWYSYFFINVKDENEIPNVIEDMNKNRFNEKYQYLLVKVSDGYFSTNEIENLLWEHNTFNATYSPLSNSCGIKIIQI